MSEPQASFLRKRCRCGLWHMLNSYLWKRVYCPIVAGPDCLDGTVCLCKEKNHESYSQQNSSP
jgi:hypothetical protein